MRRVRIAHYQVIARNDMQLCTGKQKKKAIYLIRSIKLSAVQKPRGFTLSMELLCSFTILDGNHSRRLSYFLKVLVNIFLILAIIMNIDCYIYEIPRSMYAY